MESYYISAIGMRMHAFLYPTKLVLRKTSADSRMAAVGYVYPGAKTMVSRLSVKGSLHLPHPALSLDSCMVARSYLDTPDLKTTQTPPILWAQEAVNMHASHHVGFGCW